MPSAIPAPHLLAAPVVAPLVAVALAMLVMTITVSIMFTAVIFRWSSGITAVAALPPMMLLGPALATAALRSADPLLPYWTGLGTLVYSTLTFTGILGRAGGPLHTTLRYLIGGLLLSFGFMGLSATGHPRAAVLLTWIAAVPLLASTWKKLAKKTSPPAVVVARSG